MVLTSIFNTKRIIAVLGAVIFFVVSCNDNINKKESSASEKSASNSFFSPEFSNPIDSLQIYYRQDQLVKLARLIYNLEPKLKKDSYEMGNLVYYKGLLMEEINDTKAYHEQEARLLNIAESTKYRDQKILLDYYVLENQLAAADKNGREGFEKLLYKSLDTLEKIQKKYRDESYYLKKGNTTCLLAEYYIDKKNYQKAEVYSNLTSKYMDSTKVDFYKVYYYYAKGLILANQKKPQEALLYYHKILDLAQKYHATRFLRNVYPVLNTSYNELGDFQSAAKYMLKYKMTNDTILSRQKQATDFVIAKEKELDQKAENKKRFIIIISVLVLMILLFFTGKKLLKNKTKTEVVPFINVTITDTVSQEDLHELVELSKNNENVFYLKFPEYNPLLIKDLNGFSPKLSDSEIKFCMYLSMKYTVKEIALYTNTSIKSVESKKYRLKKKINTPESEELAKRLNL